MLKHKIILNYNITNKLLGRGSYSKVYLALKDNIKYAIKIVTLDGLTDSVKLKIMDEANILKTLNHDNIIKLYDIHHTETEMYIIMEYCETTLENLMNNKLKEKDIKSLILQLVNGLYYLQQKNIIHRDIKPANILLKNNIIKICDFGFAKMYEDNIMLESVCGSPLYMAPEILLKKKYTYTSDLWSLGIILYQMIYNKHPYNNPKSIFELINRINYNKIHFDEIENISKECIELVRELLNLTPTHRITWNELKNHKWFNMNNESINLSNVLTNVSLMSSTIFHSINNSNISIDSDIDEHIIDNYIDDIESNIQIPKSKPININNNLRSNVIKTNYISPPNNGFMSMFRSFIGK